MRRLHRSVILSAIGLASLVNVALGWLTCHPLLAAAGLLGCCFLAVRLPGPRRDGRPGARDRAPQRPAVPRPAASGAPADPGNPDALVAQMLAQGRFALLLRAQIVRGLSSQQRRQAQSALEDAMALVPEGEVVLGRIDEALDSGKLEEAQIAACQGRVIRVAHFFLDRYPVTNREFHEFVAADGYEQMPLWDKKIWPAVLDFVDRSGAPGPRYWNCGCYPSGEENHPVVGVSWYEAAAFARWVGKRLPSDAEWVKAGSWPVALSSHVRLQRRYPWGDAMDRKRANLWGSGPGRIVPVDQFPDGVSVGGVYQLIGNVWEWTSGNFRAGDHPNGGELVLPTPLKSIRGGAFDTYFDNQATCQFQSGENPLARKHNIGFRCAIGVCDLALPRASEQPANPAAAECTPAAEEVPV